MSRIAITTLGTRGDVQPYLALAQRLIGRGHEVVVLAPEQFSGLAADHGVPFAPQPGDLVALIDTPVAKEAVSGSEGFVGGLKLLKHIRPMQMRLLEAEWATLADYRPDFIIYHPKSIGAPHIAEALGVDTVLASPLPGFTATSAFPTPLLPFRSLGPLNRASHVLGTHAASLLFRKTIRQWRCDSLGLSAGGAGRGPKATVYAYSRHVLEKPRDWGADVSVSGYWFIEPPQWAPDEALKRFLAAGEPPVYVGFGSMPGLDPDRTTAIVSDALERAGKRGLIATGGGALSGIKAGPHMHVIAGAPHGPLFAHVSATVHHGGAGTTGAALRAGKPTLICPHFGDQPFWGRMVADLGAGPQPIGKKAFSVETLAAGLLAMDDKAMRATSARIGEAIRAEDGIGVACAFIERAMGIRT